MSKWFHLYLKPVLIVPTANAGDQIALGINTRLVSYSIAFQVVLLMVSKLKDALVKFSVGLFRLWPTIAFGLGSSLGKDFLLVDNSPCFNAPGVPPLALIVLTHQCRTAHAEIGAACLWFW